ncbi:MAG: hypothetical protein U0936_28065, partial [Planctomycetaceae bacterium]
SHELIRKIDANPMPAVVLLFVLMLLIWAIGTKIRKRGRAKLESTTPQFDRSQKATERESARAREEEAQRKLHEQRVASQEMQRKKQEAALLPRLLSVFNILDRCDDFALLKDTLRSCERIVQESNKHKIFRKYRRSLLSSAVRFSCKGEGKGLEQVVADLKTILELLRSSEHLSVMLIDVRRNVTLARAKADGRHDIEDLEAAIAALTARHAARVEAIQKSQLSPDDKARLIEELETELSDAISKLVTG